MAWLDRKAGAPKHFQVVVNVTTTNEEMDEYGMETWITDLLGVGAELRVNKVSAKEVPTALP